VLDAKTGKLLSASAGENGLGERDGFADWRAVEIQSQQARQAVDGAQLVADELQPADWLGLHPTTDRRSYAKAAWESGESGVGLEGRLIAWILSQSARWSVEEPIATNGGVLSTGGQSVFQGQGTGEFAAFAADREATVVGQTARRLNRFRYVFAEGRAVCDHAGGLGMDRGCLRRTHDGH